MNLRSKLRRAEPSAPDLGDDSGRGAAARVAEATRTELERLKEKLAAVEAKNAEYAEMYPTFNADEHVASVVFSHVTDVCTRVALSLVSSVWRRASKVASSLPAALEFSPKMLEWYQKGARLGNTECERMLGCLYFLGVGVERNLDTAMQYFEKAAAKGHAAAQNGVGSCHFLNRRYEEALKWHTKSAAQGCTDAEINLGLLYERGHGVIKDISKAIEWYTKAAEKGVVIAADYLRRLTQSAA